MPRIDSPLGPTPFARTLGALYFSIVNRRNRYWDAHTANRYRAPSPVISVGGVNAGGTGKTPLAMLITAHFAQQGRHAALISRGYRRINRRTIVSPPGRDACWEDVGDEPAMIRRRVPACWLGIGADRRVSMNRISAQTGVNTVFILDDGFQHRRVARDVDIAVVPVNAFDDLPIPAGTLREPCANLSRADIICVAGAADMRESILQTCARIRASGVNGWVSGIIQEPDVWVNFNTGRTMETPPLVEPVALCAIARPERFANTLKSAGVTPRKFVVYPDHYAYNDRDLEPLCDMAGRNGLVTTEKDAVRLLKLKLVNRFDMWYLKIKVSFIESGSEQQFFDLLHSRTSCKGGA